ncbi:MULTISPECIES: hypothetical protein [Brevundimonas]|uniref:hypothetical protein n=1 Tax=Brevundimonas sp. 357 TaxID=2555782 RepID=UPI000F7B0EF6|nr:MULTISPECIES: hypothetical protein [Brevundimonas]RSB45288.1 hypothetical protein EGK63_08855 [Brevundimonas sp. 357]
MANGSSGGANVGLAFIVGALVVVVAVLAWFLLGRGGPMRPETPNLNVDINVPAPRLPDVPDRPAPPELPSPTEPPQVAAPEPKA